MSDHDSLRRRTVLKTIGGSLAATSLVGATTSAATSGSYTRHSYDGGWGIGLEYTKYVPDSVDGSDHVPLMVMLHGCTQNADTFKDESLMNQVAEAEGFVVVYPETTAHMNDCWRWFDDSHKTRGNGEAAAIAGIVDEVEADEMIDDQRVYITGFSAGGGMVANVMWEYADVFAAGSVHAGLMYDVASSELDGTLAMSNGGSDPEGKGQDAYDTMGSEGITSPVPTLVFHGTDDFTVQDINGDQVTESSVVANDLAVEGGVDSTPETWTGTAGPYSYTVEEYSADDGTTVVEYYSIEGMDHAWAGGMEGGAYTAPDAPDASQLTWEFCSQFTLEEPLDDPSDPVDPGEPAGSVDLQDEILADDASFTVGYSFSETADDDAHLVVESDATGEVVAETVTADGESTVAAGDVGGTADGDTITATLFESEDANELDQDETTVSDESEPELYCGTATNGDHVSNGRAYESGGCYFAEGTSDYLGCMSIEENTLEETSKGQFEAVDGCGDAGGDDDDWWSW